jgi:hypothetical protein
MKYLDHTLTGAYFAKILGTYELELQNELVTMSPDNFERVVVIGAGEGYYPIGLSLLLKLPVVTFERNTKSFQAISSLATMNNVDDIACFGQCKPQSLSEMDSSLIVMDIEGEELDFLSSGVFRNLRNCVWIIELHGVEFENEFASALSDIYDIRFIPVRPRSMSDFPIPLHKAIRLLGRRYWLCLMQEWRNTDISDEIGSVGWIVMKARSK